MKLGGKSIDSTFLLAGLGAWGIISGEPDAACSS